MLKMLARAASQGPKGFVGMSIPEIYKAFDKIGCCTFSTVDDGCPESRVAHFRGHDDDGIYFMTMYTKPFYKQLKTTGKVAVCGLCADSKVEEKPGNEVSFDDGYFARLTGEVREVSISDLKAKKNPIFNLCIADQERYPAMTTFVISRAKGEIFDYDFAKVHRDHKLERKRFSYGGAAIVPAGLTIGDACIQCGQCKQKCSFDAIVPGDGKFVINGDRCDECGDCFLVCPVNAITHKGI